MNEMNKEELILQISIDSYLLEAMEYVWKEAVNDSCSEDEKITELNRETIIAMLNDDLTEMFQRILWHAATLESLESAEKAKHWNDYAFKHCKIEVQEK
jgi:hypothetical protein